MVIDINYDFRRDAKGGDPDSRSQTLRHYHKILWSKLLPNGKDFKLVGGRNRIYLHHRSELGAFFLGSDSITHSYKNHVRKQWLVRQIPDEVNELCNAGCTIGAYIIFPNNRIDQQRTINGARGCHVKIDDRFDLTLECIRRFYLGLESPLYHTILRYKNFFDLFGDFQGYINFFLLQDLIDERGQIKFYLPFDNFAKPPTFEGVDDYLLYKHGVLDFIRRRNERIRKSLTGNAGVIEHLLFAARV
ncbi:MAG: hypothetical protein LBG77_05235 [Dysgonamonadaceae bacterium]|jgi:hypothetical protein|nr:hypothetical protein [Dysgonamonadaceae bacterium]